MGASASEIEREIKQTRDRMDDNLTRLEGKAASNARRYGIVAGIVAVAAATALGVYVVYRRTHRPTLRDRLDDLSIDNLRALVAEAGASMRDRMPSVTLRVNEKREEEPGMVQSILRRVTPALVGTAGTALLQRVAEPPDNRYAAPQAE